MNLSLQQRLQHLPSWLSASLVDASFLQDYPNHSKDVAAFPKPHRTPKHGNYVPTKLQPIVIATVATDHGVAPNDGMDVNKREAEYVGAHHRTET